MLISLPAFALSRSGEGN